MHADILKMARTEEKRACIKWFHARGVFFRGDSSNLSRGLELARQSSHDDACFLVSLFLDGAPSTSDQAIATFLAHEEDARCLVWVSQLSSEQNRRRSSF